VSMWILSAAEEFRPLYVGIERPYSWYGLCQPNCDPANGWQRSAKEGRSLLRW